MRLGGFGFIKDYDEIRKAGFDYAELDMPELEALSDEKFAAFKAHVAETAFPIPTGARLLPVAEPLFFVPGFQVTSLEFYLKSTCKKSGELGIKTLLFGNGKARWLIDEDSIKKEEVFIQFLRMLCEIAGEQGQEVLIEPLGPKYSNYINTMPEAARVIEAANMPNLFAMADIRHFVWNKEPFEDMVQYRDIVHHVHIDYPLSYPERKYPNLRDDYDYAPFFSQLKDYDGTLTVEADIPLDWSSAGADARELLAAYEK
ncbi:MAG: sugar phosphate isomerase/epimerase [Oscillospiraceae bacterium]|nr:sugar phosphate isomerase/epimerase [Oscillospiraceae bacterium]